ncbi:lactase-phlorizin hydrolase-like, partial [Dorcoceras hygrometricum]
VNLLGLQFYNNFINELLSHGIQPHVALHHCDLPQVLEDEYGGWISRKIVKDFTAYADVCFREFGDRVLYWTPVNEANIFAIGGYDQGLYMPPGRCSMPFSNLCSKGNSTTEPYIVGHNILLAHSAVTKLYKEKYERARVCEIMLSERRQSSMQAVQKGYIGFSVYNLWMVPYSNSKEDVVATQRANDFYMRWLLDPLIFGDYPEIVKKNAGKRIPAFTKDELKQIKGAIDFIGVNHYTSVLVKDYSAALQTDYRDLLADMAIELKILFWTQYPVRPWALHGLLEYLKHVYGNIPIYVHENGQKTKRNQTLDDTTRVDYLRGYIGAVLDAVRNGSNTKGYFAWSLLDCLELLDGFDSSFGMFYVDLDDKELRRYPKLSAHCTSYELKLLQSILSTSDRMSLLLFLFAVVLATVLGAEHYSRDDFPADFVFGSGTSAYQYEGAAFDDGRTPAVWDTFAHSDRSDGANGDVTCDGYHKYKEDVKLMSGMGLEAFRMSISWSRVLPNGRGPVNPLGLQFYNNFLDELISHGIQPHVTLHHLDHPQALEDEYGGWLSRKIVKDFEDYADVCFREFGDRVLYWTTINEASIFAIGGYDQGISPPGRCSPPFSYGCSEGNSSTEPYIVGHNIVLAHSAVVRLYKKKYKATQKGYIGFNVYNLWMVPYTNSKEDEIATERANDFYMRWLLDPLVFGDYPEIVKQNAGTRLPAFTKAELKQIKDTVDFIGVNHYTTAFVKDNPSSLQTDYRDLIADMAIELILTYSILDFFFCLPQIPVHPWGLYGLLMYLKEVYGDIPIYVHENGRGTRRNGTLEDTGRVEYFQAYIGAVLDAVRNGSNTKGYFEWSFLDCLELLSGFKTSMGLCYVDLDDRDLKRYPKLSAHWYSNFLKGMSVGSYDITKLGPHPSVLLES